MFSLAEDISLLGMFFVMQLSCSVVQYTLQVLGGTHLTVYRRHRVDFEQENKMLIVMLIRFF